MAGSGKRFSAVKDSIANPAAREFEMAAARLTLTDEVGNRDSVGSPGLSKVGADNGKLGKDNEDGGCCSACCSWSYYLFHEDLRIRAGAWIIAAAALAYAAFSVYVTVDLLKLLRCMHASCDDWCFKLMSASIANLTRLDDTLFVSAKIAVQWPSTTEAMLGQTEIRLKNQKGTEMMHLVTTDLPIFRRDNGKIARVIQEGKSMMEIAARVDVLDIEAGATEFGKAQSEG